MPKRLFASVLLIFFVSLVPFEALAGVRPKADIIRLKRSYDANEWHMKRFIAEYVALERLYGQDPKDPEFTKRAAELKIQIDLLSRENELILNSLDQLEK